MNLQKPIVMLARIMAPSDSYLERQLLSKLPGKISHDENPKSKQKFSSEARKVGLDKICNVVSLHLPKLKKWEVRAGTDTELKLNDLFKYYDYETSAAKDLLYRFVTSAIGKCSQKCLGARKPWKTSKNETANWKWLELKIKTLFNPNSVSRFKPNKHL